MRRNSRPLYEGELLPEKRSRGSKAFTDKSAREQIRRVATVELVAEKMLRGESRKAAVVATAKKTSRSVPAVQLMFKQNREGALASAARTLALREPNVDWQSRVAALLEKADRRRRT